jgi:hypothetical protein
VNIERMLGINEGGYTALALNFSDCVQGQRGLAAGFRTENFNDPTFGVPANAERTVEG